MKRCLQQLCNATYNNRKDKKYKKKKYNLKEKQKKKCFLKFTVA